MKIQYEAKRLGPAKLDTIATANEIIADFQQQGYELTLRQLYYQFVARGLLENTEKSYKNLGLTIADGRLTGLIDWDAIVDRTRNVRSVPHWSDPAAIVDACARQFRIDKWANQAYRPEVWIEKDALAGVFERTCTELDVPWFSCRGYSSLSEMHVGAMRMKESLANGQVPIVLHFGDHDPSGKDMTRDITERLAKFMGGVEVRRLALNWDQIEQYTPPPNPAKLSDSRSALYVAQFGDDSWELDALQPSVLDELARTAILALRDPEKWEEAVAEENGHRAALTAAAESWDDVTEFLEGQ